MANMSSDIFKKFQVLKDEEKKVEMSASLDSLEKTRYAQFYGHKPETTRKGTGKAKEKKLKRVDIEPLLEDFLKKESPFDVMKFVNIPDLKRISKYLSEFQATKDVTLERRNEIQKSSLHLKSVSWKNQHISEKLSEDVKEQKSDRSVWIGPGSISPEIQVEQNMIEDSKSFGSSRRFKYIELSTPGPGAYGKAANFHIPEKKLLKPSTNLPSFEWPPITRGDPIKPGLAPNRYRMEDHKSISEFVNRRVTKRGPYDVFTGTRDATSIKNHFAPPSLVDNNAWPTNFPGMVDKLTEHGRRELGRWGKNKRECVKLNSLPSHPSPAHYQEKIFCLQTKQNKHGFNISSPWIWTRPQIKLPVPGPGRYNPKIVNVPRKSKVPATTTISK